MTSADTTRPRAGSSAGREIWAILCGLFLGLCFVKFGNPVILDWMVSAPHGALEWIIDSWPVVIGHVSLALLGALGWIWVGIRKEDFHWGALAPLPWLAWELVAACFSADARLSAVTLREFVAATVCFYAGFFWLRRVGLTNGFWLAALACFLFAIWTGLGQHYGGLEEVRQAVYAQPNWRSLPPEYLKKIATNRIFATLFYPNAFAGVLMFWTPALAAASWRMTEHWPRIARLTAVGFLIYLAAASFFWTGSKGGWLIAVAVMTVVIAARRIGGARSWAVIAAVAIVGLGLFTWKFSGYFRRGAPSASARIEYWRAAWKTFRAHPWAGIGPGAFGIAYAKLKPPGAEMSRLAHNDYLEQASDSGAIGFAAYTLFIFGSLWRFFARRDRFRKEPVGIWLLAGLLAWALQSLIEFGLYVPGLAWPAFMAFGWGWGVSADVNIKAIQNL